MKMRFDESEKKALKYCLKDFSGDVYIFGSRVDLSQKGGDIDILLLPKEEVNSLKLSLQVQSRFFSICEQDIDVVVYNDNLFCKEIMSYAKKLDIKRI